MKIPKKLKIGGHNIRVVIKEYEAGSGFSDFTKGEIIINRDHPKSQQECTLIHEILHFCNANMSDGLEHVLLESLSQQIYQVLKDNKLLNPH